MDIRIKGHRLAGKVGVSVRSVRFGFQEVGKQTAPIPSRIAQRSPEIEVLLITTVPDHAIDEAASSNTSSHRQDAGMIVELGLWESQEVVRVKVRWLFANKRWNVNHILTIIPIDISMARQRVYWWRIQ